ncbi:hypothetical protein, partial [Caballeronia sp. M23-90]
FFVALKKTLIETGVLSASEMAQIDAVFADAGACARKRRRSVQCHASDATVAESESAADRAADPECAFEPNNTCKRCIESSRWSMK